MLEFLAANIGTILIGLLVAGIIALIILSMVLDKKKGKSSCGCGCANCAMKGSAIPGNKKCRRGT